jgi:hypothetical protein
MEALNSKKMAMELRQAKKEVATSKMMKVQIMERTENGYSIEETSRKFGLVRENRPIKKTIVNGFLQIIQGGKYDETQSIVTAEASELIANYNLADLAGNPITAQEAKDYLIVLDGQHRINAFAKFNSIKSLENQVIIPNVHVKKGLRSVREYLADINMIGHSWDTADKICVAAINNNSPILNKINELKKDGYNASAAMTICAGKRLKPSELKDIISKGDKSSLPTDEAKAVARAERFITTAMQIADMDVKTLTKRFFINGFNHFAAARTEDEAFKALEKLGKDDFDSIHEDKEFIEKLKTALQQKAA